MSYLNSPIIIVPLMDICCLSCRARNRRCPMANRLPLSLTEKERIYRGKLAGRTLAELAPELACSVHCVRKWWRVARDQGLNALRAPRRTRSKTGTLSQFD